ncbi:MAG: ATP-dependent DNA helicase RecQ [Candidatus Eremiobacterota bacterium]
MPIPLEIYLKKYFGYSSFRDGQKDIIEKILSHQNLLIIMPTGNGKSLCYQLPALLLPGLTIVISPLIALMKDQVDKLKGLGIKADFINSSMKKNEQEEILKKIEKEEIKILYIAPERIHSKTFMESLSHARISLFAVDEAHCISQWGHNFRPDYLNLKEFISWCHPGSVLALTATATKTVRKEIIKNLNMKKPSVIISGLARDNFTYEVKHVRSNREKDEILWEYLSSDPGRGIIYTYTQKGVEILSAKLKSWGLSAGGYHGGLHKEFREEIQNRFMNNELDIIVATNAFGMGIDKKDIRFVIHYSITTTVEDYYQETGRAGRDGKSAYALLLFRHGDIAMRKYFIQKMYPSKKLIETFYTYMLKQSKEILLINPEETGKILFGRSGQNKTIEICIKILKKYNCIEELPCSTDKLKKIVMKRNSIKVPVDYRKMEQLREKSLKKLDDMIDYGLTKKCKKSFLINYFL